MNTQHLQYVVEIERMRSISQAAENLFIGQPNLSRILHDMEDTLGFKIFERTSRGVRPTERGTIFLQHAKSILREMDSIEALGPRRPVANRLRICIPRSAAMLDLTSEFIATLPEDQNLDVAIRECHARKALELLANGEVEIGIIRFRSEYRDYFEEQMERIRDIRASERRFYQKITDIYSQCSADYDVESPITKEFFATVQNKLHYAVTHHTAAEIVYGRADSTKPNMGLTTWKNAPKGRIRKSDVTVAKNPIDSISAVITGKNSFYENTHGYINKDENGEEYYYYSADWIMREIFMPTLTVNYNDGRGSVTVWSGRRPSAATILRCC